MSNVAVTVSNTKVITLLKNGKSYTVPPSHVNHAKVLEKVRNQDYAGIEKLIDVSTTIAKACQGKVVVDNGQVKYNGEVVHNYVADRILELLRNQLPVKPLLLFLEKLMQNPSKASVDNLYRFLEHNAHPLLPDGNFIAYKRVRGDYKDIYTGTFDNSPGKTVEMPRNKVQDDPNVTCAAGLHVANLTYAATIYGTGNLANDGTTERLIIVSVNPADVVSVPTDYNNSKMRTAKYVVLEDYVGKEWTQQDAMKDVELEDDWFEEDEELEEDDWDWDFDGSDEDDLGCGQCPSGPKRDCKGRFCK